MSQDIIKTDEYRNLIATLKNRIQAAAWQGIEDAMSTVDPTPEQAAKPIEEQEREIMAEVKAARREQGKKRRR